MFCTVAVVQLNTRSNEGDASLLFHAKLKPVLLMCERGASQMLVSGVLCVFKCGTVSLFITFIVSDRCARMFGPYRYLFPVFFFLSQQGISEIK